MDKKEFRGLTSKQVEESRAKYGSNRIDEKAPPTFMECFMEGFEDPMIKILCAISAVMITLYLLGIVGIVPRDSVDWYEPVGTLIAVVLVNFITAKTSMASDAAYRKLKASTKKDTVKVYRDGVVAVVEIDDIVVGDVVILQSGDKIPADGALVSGDLRVDNSALNGEAEECKKFAAPEGFKIPDSITGDTFVDKHSLFKGAIVFNGEGLMEVQKVGMQTMMGKMAKDMADDEVDSPLKVKLSKLAEQISTFGYIGAVVIALAYLAHYIFLAGGPTEWLKDFETPTGTDIGIIVSIGVVTFAAMMFTGFKKKSEDGFNAVTLTVKSLVAGVLISAITSTVLCDIDVFNDITQAVMVAIVIIVCAVPEGLPLMISLVLMQNTGRLLEHNCLVRRATGIETAGGLNILFSDKTGTITKGKLEVVETFSGSGDAVNTSKTSEIMNYMNLAIGKNTGAMFDSEHRVIGGNATDQALLKFIGEDTFNKLAADTDCIVTESQGFNSANKFSQSRIDSLGKTFYKGAPERLLAKAKKFIADDGSVQDINMDVINTKIDSLAEKAMRVLAFGYSESSLVENSINDDLVIIGFVGIRDDVRPEARDAIKQVQSAGIQVVMITGDRLETAVAIAKDANLLTGNIDVVRASDDLDNLEKMVESMDTIALTSDVLAKLSDDVIKKIVGKIRVIARALPTDKSRMVRLCQELNLVTGRTCPVMQ